MGGIQARQGCLAEVHAVRGGQLILRVASTRRNYSVHQNSPSTTGAGTPHGPGDQTPKSSTSITHQSSLNKSGGISASSVVNTSTSTPVSESRMKGLLSRQNSCSRLTNLLVIPYEGRCYILEQSMDVLEKIFLRITPRELALLSLTSRYMHFIVMQFLNHYTSSYNLRVKLKSFYEDNADLLLPKEIVLKERMDANSRPELLLYSTMHQFIGDTYRVSLIKADVFKNLHDKECFTIERDVALRRNVAVLKATRELYIKHAYRNIGPGSVKVVRQRSISSSSPSTVNERGMSDVVGAGGSGGGGESGVVSVRHMNTLAPQTFVVQLRLRLSNAKWENPNAEHFGHYGAGIARAVGTPPRAPPPAIVRVSKVNKYYGTKEELVSATIPTKWWRDVEMHPEFPHDLDNARVIADRDSDWLFLRLKPFTLKTSCDLEFEFDDRRNKCLKRGVIFDFLELRSIAKIRDP